MREVLRCPLHQECDRMWTARCRGCKATCRGCKEDKPCSEFGRDKLFLRAYCRDCDKVRTKKHRDDAAASELEGVMLAELLYLHVADRFAQSMQLQDAPPSMVKRRWNISTKLTGISIADFLTLSQQELHAWPLQYRYMVLQATHRKQVVYPAAMDVHFEFVTCAPFPGPEATEEEVRTLFKQHMDPANLSVDEL